MAEPGSGKTFGYLLPAVKFLHDQAADARRRVLILVPTRWARISSRTSSLMRVNLWFPLWPSSHTLTGAAASVSSIEHSCDGSTGNSPSRWLRAAHHCGSCSI